MRSTLFTLCLLFLSSTFYSCDQKESKKTSLEETAVLESKSVTKTLEIEKPQLTFGFIKLTQLSLFLIITGLCKHFWFQPCFKSQVARL